MRCSFCGKEIENGAELCPYCGMILSLGEDDNTTDDAELRIPEYTPNIFGSGIKRQEESSEAKELPVSEVEEEVPVVETIPEYVPDEYVPEAYSSASVQEEKPQEEQYVPDEYIPEEYAPDEYEFSSPVVSVPSYADAEEEITADVSSEETVSEENAAEEISEPETEETDEVNEEGEEPYEETEISESVQEETEIPAVADVSAIRIPEEEISYPEYESFVAESGESESVEDILTAEPQEEEIPVVVVAQDGISDSDDTDEYDADDDDDTYVKSGKSKSAVGAVVALCILFVCLVFAGGYVFKNILPEKRPQKETTTDVAATQGSEEDSTSEKETTQDETEEDTTEDAETTLEDEETTTEKEETTTEKTTGSTTKAPVTTTKAPVTTRVPTTRVPSTTRVPATTRVPTTTKAPTTTKPVVTTTDPYGINNVTVKKPSSYLSSTFKGYVTVSSIKVRSTPNEAGERVLYLGKGSEVVVYAKENGFYYVYSTRFGVYGWASASYISQTRPSAESTTVPSGAVKPDKSGSGKIMYTTNTLNLRKGPATSYGIATVIPIGYPVKIVGYKAGVSGWAYVTDTTTGINGWVSTAYLR